MAILTSAIFVGAIALAVVGHPLNEFLAHQQEAAKRADLGERSRQRTDWWPGRWAPPVQLPDGSYDWNSFTLSFWMPDGAGVLTNAPELLSSAYVDKIDLKWHRSPMRPREVGRPDPSPTRYTIVVGEFCPRAGLQPHSHFQGISLTYYGYGYGAEYMYGCAADKPTKEWTPVHVYGPGRTEMFCHAGVDVCFGWIDLADEGVRALTYLPRDAVAQTPEIAARMHALLQSWKTPD